MSNCVDLSNDSGSCDDKDDEEDINAVDENLNIELTPFSFSGVMPTMADGVGGREGSSGGKN